MLTALAWPAWPPALGFIDPDRPISWLVGQCQVIAALKIAAVEKDSATFEVVKVLQGQLKDRRITVRWTATQQPPVEKAAVDAPAVLLVPRDKEDPTLIQVSPEYLAVKPDKNKPGQYDYVRLNGFVKGSFNGQSADLLALLADTLAKRAYFPIWADTSFAPAAKIGQLPGGAALAIGDLDGDGGLDIVGATAKGLVAFSAGGQGKFVAHPLPGVGPAANRSRSYSGKGPLVPLVPQRRAA